MRKMFFILKDGDKFLPPTTKPIELDVIDVKKVGNYNNVDFSESEKLMEFIPFDLHEGRFNIFRIFAISPARNSDAMYVPFNIETRTRKYIFSYYIQPAYLQLCRGICIQLDLDGAT